MISKTTKVLAGWRSIFLATLLGACGGHSTVAGFIPLPTATPTATATPTPTPTVVAQYFSLADDSAVKWDQRIQPDTPFASMNRLYVFGGWINQDSNGKYSLGLQYPYELPRMNQLLARMRSDNPSAQIVFVSGFDADGAMYKNAARNPAYFAKSVVTFLRQYNFDGYDMDWENGIDYNDLTTLLNAVGSALTAASQSTGKHYSFTMAVWPNYEDHAAEYNIPLMASTLDQINIMSYGAQDDLAADAAGYVGAGFPIGKIIGGVETEIDYPEQGGVDTLGGTGTIRAKAAFALNNGLAGMMGWRLDNDYVEAVGGVNYPTYAGAQTLWAAMTGQ